MQYYRKLRLREQNLNNKNYRKCYQLQKQKIYIRVKQNIDSRVTADKNKLIYSRMVNKVSTKFIMKGEIFSFGRCLICNKCDFYNFSSILLLLISIDVNTSYTLVS